MENSKEDLTRKVLNVLDQVRPYLQQDGGDIAFNAHKGRGTTFTISLPILLKALGGKKGL